ncbi:hypothetical protein [Tessaracoccus massiliensis]|uniref:hypothetical protein n=1 Tax=Tessaracoccus massiliensis TaxID=1522311 RepID=UPI0006933AF3|nr:hypothetical protein [Tessaracoccus massiliensis]
MEISELDDLLIEIVAEENPVTVRRVFYSATTKTDLVPKSEAGYSVVQRRLLALRRAERMPYYWIADNTRYVVKPLSYDSADEALKLTAALYRKALWLDQPSVVQIFTEKDALVSVVQPVTDEWQVPLGIMRGCASESFIYEEAQSVQRERRKTYFYQLGDHDPTGVMAWEKFEEGVRRFAPNANLAFDRIAVTEQQISEMDLPTRPTKKSDSRSASFKGDSVEVDAIPAPVLRDLVRAAIEQHVDQHQLRATKVFEESERDLLLSLTQGRREAW